MMTDMEKIETSYLRIADYYKTARVLWHDDDEEIRSLYEKWINMAFIKMGVYCRVKFSSNIDDFNRDVVENHAGLVLMDIRLGKGCGIDVYLESKATCDVLFWSGDILGIDDKERIKEIGEFTLKPMCFDEVYNVLLPYKDNFK
jgi:DNA-binding NtrC family response regulator